MIRNITLVLLVVIVTILWKCSLYPEEEIKMTEEKNKVGIIPFEVGLGDHLSNMLSKNNLNDDYYRKLDIHDSHFLTTFETYASDKEASEGYELHYTDGSCTVTFPAGRMIHLSLSAGFIEGIAFVMPLEPLSYTKAVSLVDNIIARINRAGFKQLELNQMPRTGGLPKGWDRFPVGSWKSCAYPNDSISDPISTYFTVDIRYYSTTFDAPNQYLVRVKSAHYSLEDEADDLMMQRRIEINGDKNKPLPLSVWLDNPSWRPKGWKGKYIK